MARSEPRSSNRPEPSVTSAVVSKALIFALLVEGLPTAALAEEDNPVQAGANADPAAAGAVGPLVGPPLSTAAGIVAGLTGATAPTPRHYVVERDVPSDTRECHPRVVAGEILPAEAVTLYPAPPECGVTHSQYTAVDNTPVLVDPSNRRIVEVAP